MKNRYNKSCSWNTSVGLANSLEPPQMDEGPFELSNRSGRNVVKIEDALRAAYHNGWQDGLRDVVNACTDDVNQG